MKAALREVGTKIDLQHNVLPQRLKGTTVLNIFMHSQSFGLGFPQSALFATNSARDKQLHAVQVAYSACTLHLSVYM